MSLGDDDASDSARTIERVTQQVTEKLDTRVLNDVSFIIIVTTNVVHEPTYTFKRNKPATS